MRFHERNFIYAATICAVGLAFADVRMLSANAADISDDLAMRQGAQRRVQECRNALIRQDYGALADCAPARLTQLAGGRSRVAALEQAADHPLLVQGFRKETSTYDLPDKVSVGGPFLYVLVRGHSIMSGGPVAKGPDAGRCARFEYADAAVALSEDGGNSWKVIRANQAIKSAFPELVGKVEIPISPRPTILEWLPGCPTLPPSLPPVTTTPPRQ
jgi:hypothetical protein